MCLKNMCLKFSREMDNVLKVCIVQGESKKLYIHEIYHKQIHTISLLVILDTIKVDYVRSPHTAWNQASKSGIYVT